MNVIEIDAASNNGVDNIREIVEEVSYSPAEGKYKVYIIDEVHRSLQRTAEDPGRAAFLCDFYFGHYRGA